MRRPTRTRRLLVVGMVFALTGCSLPGGYPSQAKPSCSWSSVPPQNQGALCSTVFDTLRSIASAEIRGDGRALSRLVSSTLVAQRIKRHGAMLRSLNVKHYHVRPSITLDQLDAGTLGAALYLIGKTSRGKISAPQTVYLHLRNGAAIVVGDAPAQEW